MNRVCVSENAPFHNAVIRYEALQSGEILRLFERQVFPAAAALRESRLLPR